VKGGGRAEDGARKKKNLQEEGKSKERSAVLLVRKILEERTWRSLERTTSFPRDQNLLETQGQCPVNKICLSKFSCQHRGGGGLGSRGGGTLRKEELRPREGGAK